MRSKVTVVLLFLNVVLFAYIYFYDKPTIDERKTLEARRRVLGAESATIESLTRKSRTGEVVTLEKRLDSWWLTAPYEWPADRNAIAGLLSTLELLEHETSFAVAGLEASGRSLADYGLADPTMTVTFKSAGIDYTLQVGDVTQVSNNLYLLSSDRTRIHVVSRSLAENIGLPLDILRSASIFSVPVFEVRSLNVQTAERANLKVRLRRDAAGRWNFEAPINARASKSAVEVTINAVNAITARSFVEQRETDLERAGLNSPSLQVTLEGNARRETLLLGSPTGKTVPREGAAPDAEYFAKMEDNPVVFTTAVPKPLLDVLQKAQEELRDPRVADFEPAAVTSFTLVAPGQPELTLQRLEPTVPAPGGTPPADATAPGQATAEALAKAGWQAVVRLSGASPQTIPADPVVITGLLQKISQLSAHEPRANAPKFLSDAPSATDLENWGFNRPEREITLNLNPGAAPLTLQIGVSPDKPGEAFARTTHAPFVYQVLPDILDETPVNARHYRLRVLRELPETARVTGIKLTEIGAATPLVELTNEGGITPESFATGSFKMDPGAATPAAKPLSEQGRAVLVSLLGQVRTLRAKSFTAGTYTPDHAETPTGPQPWKYQLEIVTAFAAGAAPAQNSTTTLLLTERLGGSTMLAGTTEFGGVVFEVTQEMLDAIFALTYTAKQDPGPPAPTPASPEMPNAKSQPPNT